METLKKRAASSVGWSSLDAVTRQGSQFAVSLVLARLLSPSDFGVMAMLVLLTGIASIIVDGGFADALIQSREVSQEATSSVFFVNLGVGCVIGALFALSAPLIAWFYRVPELEGLTRFLALNFVISALGAVQLALMARNLQFRSYMLIGVVSTLVAGTLAVVLALSGAGVWSLAVQSVAATTLVTVLLWRSSAWRPSLCFSLNAIKPLWRFGAFMLLANMASTVSNQFYTIIVGRFYSAAELGLYSRADASKNLPGSLISRVVTRVAFPLFSAAKADLGLIKRGLAKANGIVMYVNVPVMLCFAGLAEPLLVTLFGKQWAPAAPYLAILALAAILWPMTALNIGVMKAVGRSHAVFRNELVMSVVVILGLLIGSYFGLVGLAWSAVVASMLAFLLAAFQGRLCLQYGPWLQLLGVWRLFAAGGAMVVAFFTPQAIGHWPPQALLALQGALGIAIYLAACTLLRVEAQSEVFQQGSKALSSMITKKAARLPE